MFIDLGYHDVFPARFVVINIQRGDNSVILSDKVIYNDPKSVGELPIFAPKNTVNTIRMPIIIVWMLGN